VTLPLAAQRSSGFWVRLQRERALIALFDLGRQKSYGLRAAKLYAFSVFAGYAIAISLARGTDRRAAIHGFIQAALVSLSWVVGALAGLGAAQALAEQPERDALSALAMQRGFPKPALLRARTLAAAVRVASLVGVPALLLVLLGVARGGTLSWALSLSLAVLVYASTLGLTLALLAHFAAELSPSHPRALLTLLVLGPLLVSLAYPAVPSLPRLFSSLLSRLLAVGTWLP
jgi:hypothetical protein